MALTGGNKLAARMRELSKRVSSGASVQVGFLEGSTIHGGKSAPMIAAIQEYGAPSKGIPPRPFMRNAIAKHSGEWGDMVESALIKSAFDAEVALGAVGDVIRSQVQDSIREIKDPPLSPVTLLLRQRFGNSPSRITFGDVQEARRDVAAGVRPNVTGTQAKPLIWTGEMLNAVNFAVTKKGA